MYQEFVVDKTFFINVIKDLKDMVEENRDYLSKLDSDIGDGDHGINMSIGFRGVIAKIEELQEEDISNICRKVGMILLGKIGGASGPLYGSFFMKLGVPVKGKEKIHFYDFYEMLKAGIEAIENRGKAVVGDKTMVDALRPALDEFTQAIEENKEPLEAFHIFVEASRKGAQTTIPLVAKKGRAMRLGERAIGHIDPGAVSATLILETIENNLIKIAK
ncbi:dihydroxyacetone kinase subunit DhaL [Irregularibacter muris]|uniref:phosphoenolpyruvate--glycerone phosphotransferase n=1 Tax=Irregularibacter muris TaxID=1796619 RepID=A0AAE3HK79_9FIRM|nr:dihydroxyacetone kinase subunit DhaL [Irregularibacter muris]MCR1900304.1 dihydroxyacetone kinase subunit DhaL [Irregularibacter muris]